MFFDSYGDAIARLRKPENQLAAFWALVNYGEKGILPDENSDDSVLAIFYAVKPSIDSSRKLSEARSAAGAKGGKQTQANAKQTQATPSNPEQPPSGEESRGEESRVEDCSKSKRREKNKKDEEKESPRPLASPTSTNVCSKEDAKALKLLHKLTEAERNPGPPPLDLPPDVRDRYTQTLVRARAGDASCWADVPCAGGFCRSHVQVGVDELEEALKTNRLPSTNFFCPHCKEHGGVGRLFENWRKACPKKFQEGIDTTRFPQRAWSEIKGWGTSGCEQPLYIYGDVGTGKSRMAYFVLFNYVARRKLRFETFTWQTFQDMLRKKSTEDVCSRLVGMDVILIDDFGATRLTEKATLKLQTILENQMLAGKRIIFVASEPPESLDALRGEPTAAAHKLVSRINASSILVKTDK